MDAAWLDSIQSHVERLSEAARETVVASTMQNAAMLTKGAESPIEAIFALWWNTLYPLWDSHHLLTLHPQFCFAPIDGHSYRADFVIWPTDMTELAEAQGLGVEFHPIVIELDGHEFHERTPEQVITRNRRDRAFVGQGYRVMHFSGAEIHRDPYGVFTDVFGAACSEWCEYIDALRGKRKVDSE